MADRRMFPLTVTLGKHNFCHIESSVESPIGPGLTLFSVPRKYQWLAVEMVEAVNAKEANLVAFAKVMAECDAAERGR